MNKCPNKNSKEWKTLVAQVGEDMAWATWVSNNGEYPETLMSTSELKKALGFRTPCSRDQVINLYERIKRYNSKHNTAHSAPKSQVGQADLYDLRFNIAYMSKDILKKTIDEGHAEVLGTDQARDFINSNPEIFISEGNQYFRDGEVYGSYEDAINSSLDYDRPFAEKLFRNYEKDFIPADKDKVYELLALAKNQGISGVLNHIISNTKDPIIKIFAKAFLDNIDRAGFLQIKFDVARDRYGNYVQDASGSYGGGIININWKKVFFNATNLIHKNGLDSGYKSIIHELVHVYTLQALRNPKTSKEKEFKNKITKAYNTLKQDAAFKSDYGLSSVEEFISEIISNPEFRGTLNIYKAGFLAKIINYIAKLFGYTKDISMEESNRASIIHETVNTFLKDLPYLTPSKGKSIYYDKANNIKPGVSELFESNPELANAVYGALGFKQNITKDLAKSKHDTDEHRFSIGNFIKEKNSVRVTKNREGDFSIHEGDLSELTKQQKIALFQEQSNAIPIGGQIVQRGASSFDGIRHRINLKNYGFSIKYGTDNLQEYKSTNKKEVQEFADLYNLGKVIEKDGKLFTKGVILTKEKNIDQITPQQKQQAQQLYSQYLDTIFPDSKVKDIVYAGSKEKFDKFKIGDTDNKKDFGIYFGSWISHYFGESGRGYLNRTTALINITNPRIINSITINSENNNDVENNEAIILSSADASNIKQFYNMGKEDGIIQLGYSHSNDEVDYKDSEDIYNKEVVELLEKVIKEVKTIGIEAYFDKLADNPALQKEGHVALKQAINSGITLGNTLEEAVVFKPEQIHILSSKKDLEMFRNFINFKKSEYAKYGDIQQFRDYIMSKNFAAIEEFLVVNNKIGRKC